jgi:hypothetical protein
MLVVNKGDIMSYKNVILYLDSFADEGMARDFDILSDLRVFLDLDKGSNLTVLSDGAPVEIDEGKDTDTQTQLDIGSDATEFRRDCMVGSFGDSGV